MTKKNYSLKRTSYYIFLLFILGLSIGLLIGVISERMQAEKQYETLSRQYRQQMDQQQNTNYVNNNDLEKFQKESAILAPKKGEVLCLGHKYTIQWHVPADDEEGITLKIALPEDGDSIHDIGSFPGTYNSSIPGEGSFTWIVGSNTDNVDLAPGPAYHIFLQGDYKGWGLLSADSPLFTIYNCSQTH